MSGSRVIRRNGIATVEGGSAEDRRMAVLEAADADTFAQYTRQTWGLSPRHLEAVFKLHAKLQHGGQIERADAQMLHEAYGGRVHASQINSAIRDVNSLPAANRGEGMLWAVASGDAATVETVRPVVAAYAKHQDVEALNSRLDARAGAAAATAPPAFDPKSPAGAATADRDHRRAVLEQAMGKRPAPAEHVQRTRIAAVLEGAHEHLKPVRDAEGKDTRDSRSVTAAAYDAHMAHRFAQEHLGAPTDAQLDAEIEIAQDIMDGHFDQVEDLGGGQS
jgi:hypothetical protein